MALSRPCIITMGLNWTEQLNFHEKSFTPWTFSEEQSGTEIMSVYDSLNHMKDCLKVETTFHGAPAWRKTVLCNSESVPRHSAVQKWPIGRDTQSNLVTLKWKHNGRNVSLGSVWQGQRSNRFAAYRLAEVCWSCCAGGNILLLFL